MSKASVGGEQHPLDDRISRLIADVRDKIEQMSWLIAEGMSKKCVRSEQEGKVPTYLVMMQNASMRVYRKNVRLYFFGLPSELARTIMGLQRPCVDYLQSCNRVEKLI